MDFKKVLSVITKEFKARGVRFALIGGIGMSLRGAVRATVDIDFLVNKGDLEKIRSVMEDNGYRCIYQSENVSQYVSDVKLLGAIDLLHAFRPISLKMLEKSEPLPVFEGELQVPVLKTEDIIGLKIQAIANNPERRELDGKDIENLLSLHGGKGVDWKVLRQYFELFHMNALYEELRRRYG